MYTVDVHTLFAVRRLYALRAGDLVEQEPELSREMRDLKDPLPLYLGMLLHDAGKGGKDAEDVVKIWREYCDACHYILVGPKSQNPEGWMASVRDPDGIWITIGRLPTRAERRKM